MLLAIEVKLDGEDEQVKKEEKRSVWMKLWLKNRLRKGAYQNIFQELRLRDKEGTPGHGCSRHHELHLI